MNFHNITKDDMLNGEGLRVVLWVAGCEHYCEGCHNQQTWNPNSGIEFTEENWKEIEEQLEKPYISGITFSGGDPLFVSNRETIHSLIKKVNTKFPNKNIWLYTGYTKNEILQDNSLLDIVKDIDVVVAGRFDKTLLSLDKPWVGSSNQEVINIKEWLKC